jgi:hypothetical protein
MGFVRLILLIVILPGFAYSFPVFSKEMKRDCGNCHYFPPQLNREGRLFKYSGTRTTEESVLPETRFSFRLKFSPLVWIRNEDEGRLSFFLPEKISLSFVSIGSGLISSRMDITMDKEGKISGENLYLDLTSFSDKGINFRFGRFPPFDFSFSGSRTITRTTYSLYTLPLSSGREIGDMRNGIGIYGIRRIFYNLFLYMDEGEGLVDYSLRLGGYIKGLMLSLYLLNGRDKVGHDTTEFNLWGGESGLELFKSYLKFFYMKGKEKVGNFKRDFNGGFIEISHLFNKNISGVRYDFENGDIRSLRRIILFLNIPIREGNFLSLEYLFDLLNRKVGKFLLSLEFNF